MGSVVGLTDMSRWRRGSWRATPVLDTTRGNRIFLIVLWFSRLWRQVRRLIDITPPHAMALMHTAPFLPFSLAFLLFSYVVSGYGSSTIA
jgi:hypothetical protein